MLNSKLPNCLTVKLNEVASRNARENARTESRRLFQSGYSTSIKCETVFVTVITVIFTQIGGISGISLQTVILLTISHFRYFFQH